MFFFFHQIIDEGVSILGIMTVLYKLSEIPPKIMGKVSISDRMDYRALKIKLALR